MPNTFTTRFLKSARLAAVLVLLVLTPSAALAQTAPESAVKAYKQALLFLKQTPPDYAKAMPLLGKAAEQGYVEAQVLIGFAYMSGTGVAQDYNKAASWYTKAAGQRNAEAQFSLAIMYYGGAGVTKNISTAYMWAKISHSNGMQHAEDILNRLAASMTQEQITKAQDRAIKCLASNYKSCN